jgi:aminoglycoside phosphotransferase family enzyme
VRRDIVGYAVRMRRLPDERSADALLRHVALTPEHLTRLAARLARFFGDAAPAVCMGTS